MTWKRPTGAVVVALGLFAVWGGREPLDPNQPEQTYRSNKVAVDFFRSYGDIQALVDSSTVVVEGTIEAIEYGPVVGDGGGAEGFLDVSVRVATSFLGAEEGAIVHALVLGYDPDSRGVQIATETHPVEIGARGVWFLRPTQLDTTGPGLYPVSSTGWIKEGSDGTAVTSGQDPVAAETCGKDMEIVSAEIQRAVAAESSQQGGPEPTGGAVSMANECVADL